jgi:tetratricopeptide (TPR) repeat protein
MLAYLGVPEENLSEAAVFRALGIWLRDSRHRNWLLIIDSADSEDILLHIPAGAPTNARWIEYLGSCNYGSILFTTRTRSVALEVVGEDDIITVKPMERKHALELLKNKLGNDVVLEQATQLAKELDFIPLAMVQASSYIRNKRSENPVAEYITKLRKSDRSLRALMTRKRKRGKRDFRRDWEAENAIFLTWEISFEHILTTRKSAIDLLSLMSCFDRQTIPEALLGQTERERHKHANEMRGRHHKGKNNGSSAHDGSSNTDDSMSDGDGDYDSSSTSGSDSFDEDLLILQHYSFISRTSNPSTFEMHRLVQLATQGWLESHKSLKHWQLQFITNLDSAFPVGNYENWTKCRELFPHATIASNMTLTDQDAVLRQASLLDSSGLFALEQGDYGVAKQMLTLSMDLKTQRLGTDDPATVTSMHNLALLHQKQGEYELALELGKQVVEKRKRSSGPEHPDTLMSMNNLAATHRYTARPDLAAMLHEQVLQVKKRTLGLQDLETAMSMNNLSTVYQYQGLYKRAAELGEQALEIRQSLLGAEHPHIATSMTNLAMTYQYQGRYQQAVELGKRALEMKRKVLKPGHPQIATSMTNLAITYRSLKRYGQAAEMEEQALEMRERGLGAHHPDTLTCMSNLAKNYRLQDRCEEAANLGEQVLQIRKKLFPPDHPSVATSIGNLAATYRSMKRHHRAIELGREALEIRKKVLKPDHPHIATNMHSLALSMSSCQSKDLLKEAAELHDQALRIRQRALGPAHPDTLISRSDLANSLRALNYDEEAVEKALRLAGPSSGVV